MKRILSIVQKVFFIMATRGMLFSFVACGSKTVQPSEPVNNKTRVVIMAGQSNMEGWSHVKYAKDNLSEEEYGVYDVGAPSVRIAFYKSSVAANGNPFQNVKFGLGVDSSRFGPEVGMSRYLKENARGTKFYLIKYAVGGTNLYRDWSSPSTGTTGSQYKAMVEYVMSVLTYLTKQNVDFSVTDFCFMQGEADADTSMHALDYADRLRMFISDLRSELSEYAPSEGIRFIDGGISDSSYWPFYVTLNESKKEVAEEDPMNIYIDTIAAKLEYDKEPKPTADLAHYDALSMIELGKLFAKAMLS